MHREIDILLAKVGSINVGQVIVAVLRPSGRPVSQFRPHE